MIEPIARILIELQDIRPTVWRRLEVPLSSTLLALHDIIQIAMGWNGCHLFEFHVGDKVYGDPQAGDDDWGRTVYKAKSLRLKTLVERGVGSLLYVYDFGDDWRHDVTVEMVCDGQANTDYPVFVDGCGRCPPDDVGGVPGFMGFLEAALDPAHPEHGRMLEWYGGPFDPDDINLPDIRRMLAWAAYRRRGPLASHRGGSRGQRKS